MGPQNMPHTHPYPDLVFHFKGVKSKLRLRSQLFDPVTRILCTEAVRPGSSDCGASCGPRCFLLEERDLVWALAASQVGTHFTWTLKFQLVAGSPLPVPSCWVTVLYFTALRCLPLGGIMPWKAQKQAGTQVWKNRATFGDKETNYSICSNMHNCTRHMTI